MGAMLIAFRNYADGGALSGGRWTDGLPLANLAERQPSRLARTRSAAPEDTRIALDIGGSRPISVVALLRHNLTQAGRWRVAIGDDPGLAAPTRDSGFADIWPTIVPFGVGAWGEFRWGGKLDPAEAGAYGIDGLVLFSPPARGRHVLVELRDPDNPAGFLQAGRLIVAPAWRPSVNLQYGWSIEQVDESRSVKSRGGQVYIDRRPKFRRLSFSLDHLEADEMFGHAYELDRLKGRGGDVLAAIDPEDARHRHRHSVYGMLAETTPIGNPYAGRFAKEFVVEELI